MAAYYGISIIIEFLIFIQNVFNSVYDYAKGASILQTRQPNDVYKVEDLPDKLPTIIDIKKAIPPICFKPKVLKSMFYAISDFILVFICFLIFYYSSQLTNFFIINLFLMLVYWAIQGTLFTAVFVIGHDCGHGSFSDYSLLNDIVGTVMHSFLFAPFYMWKLSHNQHHKNNANIDKDEVFYPVRESEPSSNSKVLPFFGFGVGWFGYLVFGYKPRAVKHWDPFEEMFSGHILGCMFSLLGLGVMSYLLYKFYLIFGFMSFVNYYLVPDFIFASYCVVITFLQHHELNVPWFANSEWNFLQGQLSTIDRDYGMVHNIIHDIGTHQVHHLFTKIPHYHLKLATKHFREHFPDLVRINHDPIMPSFFKMFKLFNQQSVIKDDTAIHYYKN